MTEALTTDSLAALMDGLRSAAQRTAPVAVPMPEMGATLHVARMTTAEWLDPDSRGALPDGATEAHKRAWSVARWVTDAQGARLVRPDNAQALDLFAALPWEASLRILQAAGVMNEAEEKNA